MSSWSVVVPYFNEAGYLEATLQSLVCQTLPPARLILVDNASTDASERIARGFMQAHDWIDTLFLREERPGKILALATGLAAVETPFVATCDADTYYPPDYLRVADRLFVQHGSDCVGAMACDLYAPPDTLRSRARRAKIVLKSGLFGQQCHTGGYGQLFRTTALRAVGGFDRALWPYVLEDHEVANRLLRVGRMRAAFDLWCMPSERRMDRSAVDWTRLERLVYKCIPLVSRNWFFYTFLAERLARRGLGYRNLRNRDWEAGRGPAGGVAVRNRPADKTVV